VLLVLDVSVEGAEVSVSSLSDEVELGELMSA
jgi:hypothetical protein